MRQYAGKQMQAILETAETVESAEPAPEPVRRSVAAPIMVGAADDRAEVEADAVAAQVMARLADAEPVPHSHAPGCGHEGATVRRRAGAPGAVGAAGGALDEATAADLAAASSGGESLPGPVRGFLEGQLGADLGSVRVHADAQADNLASHLSAQAFTHGSDIFFSAGAYQPGSPSGLELIAHEATHVIQQQQGRVQPTVSRKLRGTADALENQGQDEKGRSKSTKGLRKLVGKLTNWDKIVQTVREYEAQEAQLLAGGNPSQTVLGATRPKLLKLLKKVDKLIADWRKANDDESENKKADDRARKQFAKTYGNEQLDTDTRAKAGRRQAIAMLVPRVNTEMGMLSSGDGSAWLGSLGLSPQKVTGVGKSDGGQKNTVQQLTYDTEGGSFTGYFKKDKGFTTLEEQELDSGITAHDPNFGARAVALYRLDQLFNAGVTARAEFAVHHDQSGKAVMGTVLEDAMGQKISDYSLRGGSDQMTPGSISLEDPVLQRGLNKLQLLDAIAGQLDRHGGNYRVRDDGKGNVTGVVGIDLDMAFGGNMTSTDKQSMVPTAINYRGLPDAIDQEMGERILQVKDSDIRAALTGLLPKAEVEATVMRFLEVRAAVQTAKDDGTLVSAWGAQTAKNHGSWAKSDRGRSYYDVISDLRREQIDRLADEEVGDLVRWRLRGPGWGDLPDIVLAKVRDATKVGTLWKGRASSAMVQAVAAFVYENDLGVKAIDPCAQVIVDTVFNGLNSTRIALDAQEMRPDQMHELEASVREMIADILKNRGDAVRASFAKVTTGR